MFTFVKNIIMEKNLTDIKAGYPFSGSMTGIATSSTYPWNNTSTNMFVSKYSSVDLIDTLVSEDIIELVYKGVLAYNTNPYSFNVEIWKDVYGCVDGKLVKIEQVFGEYIPPQEESYSF